MQHAHPACNICIKCCCHPPAVSLEKGNRPQSWHSTGKAAPSRPMSHALGGCLLRTDSRHKSNNVHTKVHRTLAKPRYRVLQPARGTPHALQAGSCAPITVQHKQQVYAQIQRSTAHPHDQTHIYAVPSAYTLGSDTAPALLSSTPGFVNMPSATKSYRLQVAPYRTAWSGVNAPTQNA